MVSATLEVYRAVTLQFLPTPSKCHYVFNLRDFSRVVRGTLLLPPSRLRDLPKLVLLWLHEIYRVFADRLVDDDDR